MEKAFLFLLLSLISLSSSSCTPRKPTPYFQDIITATVDSIYTTSAYFKDHPKWDGISSYSNPTSELVDRNPVIEATDTDGRKWFLEVSENKLFWARCREGQLEAHGISGLFAAIKKGSVIRFPTLLQDQFYDNRNRKQRLFGPSGTGILCPKMISIKER